jgi:hypothetical protein
MKKRKLALQKKRGGKIEGKSAFLKSLLKITTANQSSIISVRI